MKKQKPGTGLRFSPRAIALACYSVCTLLGTQPVKAQNGIDVERAGFDKVRITNRAGHSQTIEIGGRQTFVAGPNGSKPLAFELTESNVKRMPITAGYDSLSYYNDCHICIERAKSEVGDNAAFHAFIGILAALFGNEYGFEKALLFIKGFGALFGMPTDRLDEFIGKLAEVWADNLSLNEKRNRLEALGKSFLDKTAQIERSKRFCFEAAEKRLANPYSVVYYASQFIFPQEKSKWELTAFGVAGNRVRLFRKAGNVNTIQRLGYDVQPAYGLRGAFSFNAYKGGLRKWRTRYYIPVTATQSPAVFKASADSVFTKQTGYSWRTYSIGWGWENLYFGGNGSTASSSAFLDLGVVTSTASKHTLEGERIIRTAGESSFKGLSPYINVGMKIRLTAWADLYGSYYSTLLYTNLKYNKGDLPSFREFHLGLNLNFGRHYSYQY